MLRPYVNRRQRLIQVPDQILHILDPDGQPDQAVGQAHPAPHLEWDAGVGHRRRVPDQALDASQRLGQCKDLGSLDEAAGELSIAQLDADHPPNPFI